jgi:hypothetical protein
MDDFKTLQNVSDPVSLTVATLPNYKQEIRTAIAREMVDNMHMASNPRTRGRVDLGVSGTTEHIEMNSTGPKEPTLEYKISQVILNYCQGITHCEFDYADLGEMVDKIVSVSKQGDSV